jgi:hypothetical protein
MKRQGLLEEKGYGMEEGKHWLLVSKVEFLVR